MSEEKKQQLAVKVEAEVLEQFNTMSDLLVKTGAVKTKGDAVKYLLEQVNLQRLLEDNEWSEELQAMNHYADMLVGLFQSVITKTKTQRDVLRESKDKDIVALQEKVNELQVFTKSFEEELRSRDELIGQQAKRIAELESQAEEQAADYENLQLQYKSVHTLFEEANENRKQVLLEKERHIGSLEKQLEDHAQENADLAEAYKALQEEQSALQAENEAKLLELRSEYESKLEESRSHASTVLAAQEEKTEQLRQAYENRIEAMRTEQAAAQVTLRGELEQKYEGKLQEAQRTIQELTAAAAKADTLRQLVEEQLAEQKKKASRKPKKGTDAVETPPTE